MGVIGVKNIAQGGYNFAINLPEQTKKLLQENKGLKGLLTAKYLEWRTLTTKLENLTEAEEQLIKEQEKVLKMLGVEDAKSIRGMYNLASISKEKGFVDLLPDLLKKESLTMCDFRYLMQKNANALTDIEEAKLANIRKAIPKPDGNTLMQKVISKDAINNYLKENNPYTTIGGFVTRASDAKHFKTYDDLYFGLRLDYINDEGRLVNFVEDGSCGVIRFKSESASELYEPREELLDTNKYPYTGHGFTSGKQGRLGVPEWKFRDCFYAPMDEGAELYEVFSYGREILISVYEERNGIKKNYEINNYMKIRMGTYGYLDNHLLEMISVPGGYEFFTNDSYIVKKYNFKTKKSLYSGRISHRLFVKGLANISAFHVRTYCKYRSFDFFVDNAFENNFILRPLEEAMKHFKDFPRQGYDPVYEVTESKITDIWE